MINQIEINGTKIPLVEVPDYANYPVFGSYVGINNVFNTNFECNVYSLPIGTSRTLTVHIMYHDCAEFSLELMTAIEL